MAETSSQTTSESVFVIQTKNRQLVKELAQSLDGSNVELVRIESAETIREQPPHGRIITFIIGSDVKDPVQSLQRLHTLEKSAKIIVLARSEKNAGLLKEAIKFSPFIGTNVSCLDESAELDKLGFILQKSLKAKKYRAIIDQTNTQISATVTSQVQHYGQHFINQLMDVTPIGIAVVNEHGKILGWNKEATNIFGRYEAQVVGRPISHLFSEPGAQKLDEYITKGFELRNKPLQSLELVRALPDISRQILRINAAVCTFSDKQDEVLILTINDITEQKLAEAQLLEMNFSLEKQAKELAASNAELEQFAFVASHDLQEPLRMITSFLARLENKYDSVLDEKGKTYIHIAVDGAKRMRQIILDLLEFSRVGRVELERKEIDLNELLQQVISNNKKLISDQGAIIDVDELPVIKASKGPILQLFQNLISNALKYQAEGNRPVVKVIASEDDHFWKFEVRDNGIGIDPKFSDKIFNIFQRLHSRTEYSGTGIGLAICKKIVEVYGGQIWVESEEGKGSTFTFTIMKEQGGSHIQSVKPSH